MGLRAYNRQILEDLISEARARGYAVGYALGYAEARSAVYAKALAQGYAEGYAAGRRGVLDELRRAKNPEEIRQILERAGQSDGSDNNCG